MMFDTFSRQRFKNSYLYEMETQDSQKAYLNASQNYARGLGNDA